MQEDGQLASPLGVDGHVRRSEREEPEQRVELDQLPYMRVAIERIAPLETYLGPRRSHQLSLTTRWSSVSARLVSRARHGAVGPQHRAPADD